MNIVVFGASGKTGLQVVRRGLSEGYQISAFVRSAERLPVEHPRLQCVLGNVFDFEAVNRAVRGQDAVVCALGTKGMGQTTVRAEGTKTIIAAMQRQEVRRLVVVSTLGASESWAQLSRVQRVLFTLLLKHPKIDHDRQEEAVQASGLAWTLVRPGELTDQPFTGRYTFGSHRTVRSGRVSRADVADLILRVLGDQMFVSQAVTVTRSGFS